MDWSTYAIYVHLSTVILINSHQVNCYFLVKQYNEQ